MAKIKREQVGDPGEGVATKIWTLRHDGKLFEKRIKFTKKNGFMETGYMMFYVNGSPVIMWDFDEVTQELKCIPFERD